MYKIFTNFFCTPPGYKGNLLLGICDKATMAIGSFLKGLNLILAMKLTTILLIVSILQVSASSFAQKVTISQNNMSLEQVFKQIRTQSGYKILIDVDLLKSTKTVSLDVKDVTAEEAIALALKNQGLEYEMKDGMILIKKKESTFLERLADRWTSIDISGRVVDADGRGLPGASVSVKGKAVSTDANGNFYMKGVDEDAVLVVSFIGYVSKEVKAAKELGDVVLELSTSKLDEVQVIAYGTTTRRLSTSNINTIKADEVGNQPVSNLLLALQGRVPGVQINQTSGISGGSVNVNVQGRNSIRSGNEAFYVIDGVPYQPQNLYSGIGSVFPGTGSTLGFINPSDIESVDFLKDADATAIYGARAANGAILITTKKGKSGNTKVDLNIQNGWGEVTRKLNLLNTDQYLAIRREAFKNNNNAPFRPTDYDVNGTWDQNRYTDWHDKLVGGTAHFANMTASISGGNTQTQFSAGAGYNRQTTVFPGDFADVKANIHTALNHISNNQKFTFNLSTSYQNDVNKLPAGDLTPYVISTLPNAPAMYDSAGNINWEIINNKVTYINNPASPLLQKYNVKTSNLVSSSLLSYEILRGLKIKSTFGYNRLEAEELYTLPQASIPPLSSYNARSARYGNKYMESWILEPQLTYSKNFKFGSIDALLGGTFQSNQNKIEAFEGSGYANDAQLGNSLAASTIIANRSNGKTEYRYNAIFARLNYRYNDKYIFNATMRRDGSSRFGLENLSHDFYSLGGAWLFAEEGFFKEKLSFINYGKIRITYGTTGNDQIPDYQFLSLYNLYPTSFPYQQGTALYPTGHTNPYLQWEETRKFNIGLDLGFFNDRILVNTNYAKNRSSNQLVNSPLPSITGFPTLLINSPATVQNTSWEFLVDAQPIRGKVFNWKTSLNLTIPKNKLIRYPNLENSADSYSFIIGESLNIRKAYSFVGINPQSGLYEFKTLSGEITSEPNSLIDKTTFVNLDPKYYGGLNNSINYKGFQLDILLQFVDKIAANYKYGSQFPGSNTNQPISFLNRWQKLGDMAPIQKISRNPNTWTPYLAIIDSNAGYSDASFVRLKSAGLSYTLPNGLLQKAKIANARVYFQGQNLLTFTHFDGLDPETESTNVLPPLRVFSIGFQLTL